MAFFIITQLRKASPYGTAAGHEPLNVEIKSLKLIHQLVQMAMEITAIPSLTGFVCMSLRLCIRPSACHAFGSKTTPLHSLSVNHIV